MTLPMRTYGLPLPDDIRAQWRHLEASSPQPSIFRTPEWVEARAEALRLGGQTTVYMWADGDRLVAAFAVTDSTERIHPRLRTGIRVLANAAAGVGAADHTGWTASDHGHEEVLAWLQQAGRTVLLRNLDPALAERASTVGMAVHHSRCPRLDLTNGPGPAPQFAKKVAYYRRRAEREGLRLSRTFAGDATAVELTSLRVLHQHRFGGSSVLTDSGLAIQEALLRRQRPEVGPVVVTASLNGRTVGILWALWFAGVYAYYQTGWLPEFKSLNLGTVMVDEAILMARELGAHTFDFLRGPEPYKYRFGAADRIDTSILLPRGVPGSLLRLKERMKARSRGAASV